MLGGALISLQIAFITFWIGALIGIFGALAKVYGTDTSKNIASSYVTLFTNTPALVPNISTLLCFNPILDYC